MKVVINKLEMFLYILRVECGVVKRWSMKV